MTSGVEFRVTETDGLGSVTWVDKVVGVPTKKVTGPEVVKSTECGVIVSKGTVL